MIVGLWWLWYVLVYVCTLPIYNVIYICYYRGTSGIDIDLRRVDIDQCPQRNVPGTTQPLNIFAGTDKCKNTTEVSDAWRLWECANYEVQIIDFVKKKFPFWGRALLNNITFYSVFLLLDLDFDVVRTSVSAARDSTFQIPVYRKNISTVAHWKRNTRSLCWWVKQILILRRTKTS